MALVPKSVVRTRRLFEILGTIRRYGLGELAGEAAPRWLVGAKKDFDDPVAKRLRLALEELGPVFIKFGQMLSTRRDLLPDGMAEELSRLQDDVPPFQGAKARALIEAAYGHSLDEFFAVFDDESMAAASIAQVHPATVIDRDGTERKVAVKILRPGVARRFRRDLDSFYLVARAAERFHPPSRRLRPVAIVDTLAQSVALEMDFRLEAAGLSEMSENTAEDPGFRVPDVDWIRTSKGVLTMEWIDGRKMSDVEGLREDGHDMEALGAAVIQSFLRHTLRDGFFHADMHQGNLFVEPDGTLVAVDFGITGR
ncbi:AarF/UbiB family protein, partial [uncultured Salinisphaera sp.]|uniref:ABC1 kinase family protein n=1 Tax=uncultured Salinisphaera sp. TaxID=359372 RepID=UPI0032B28180